MNRKPAIVFTVFIFQSLHSGSVHVSQPFLKKSSLWIYHQTLWWSKLGMVFDAVRWSYSKLIFKNSCKLWMDLTLHREGSVFTGEDSFSISIEPGLDITGEKIRLTWRSWLRRSPCWALLADSLCRSLLVWTPPRQRRTHRGGVVA